MKKLKISIAVISMMLLLTACGNEQEQITTTQQITTTEYVTETLITEEITSKETEVVTEQETEEITTESSTLSNSEQKTLDEMTNIKVSLLDEYHGTFEDAGWNNVWQRSTFEEFKDSTILSLYVEFPNKIISKNANYTFVNSNGEDIKATTATYEISNYSEQYHFSEYWISSSQEDDAVYGVMRVKIGGNVKPEDVAIKFLYDENENMSVIKTISDITTFEAIRDKVCYNEYINEKVYPIEAEKYNKVNYTYLYNIKGVWCIVEPSSWGYSTGASYRNGKDWETISYNIFITPLQGPVKATLFEDKEITSDNINPDESMKDSSIYNKYGVGILVDKARNRGTTYSINLEYLIDSNSDWYKNFDSLSSEEKGEYESLNGFVKYLRREQGRRLRLQLPDGEGNLTQIPCILPFAEYGEL